MTEEGPRATLFPGGLPTCMPLTCGGGISREPWLPPTPAPGAPGVSSPVLEDHGPIPPMGKSCQHTATREYGLKRPRLDSY